MTCACLILSGSHDSSERKLVLSKPATILMWLELVLKYRYLEFQGPQLQPILLSSQDSDKQKTDIKVTRRPAKG